MMVPYWLSDLSSYNTKKRSKNVFNITNLNRPRFHFIWACSEEIFKLQRLVPLDDDLVQRTAELRIHLTHFRRRCTICVLTDKLTAAGKFPTLVRHVSKGLDGKEFQGIFVGTVLTLTIFL